MQLNKPCLLSNGAAFWLRKAADTCRYTRFLLGQVLNMPCTLCAVQSLMKQDVWHSSEENTGSVKKTLLILLLAVFSQSACNAPSASITFPKIDRRPSPANYNYRQAITSVPTYNPNSDDPWQMDLRSCNLIGLDLSSSLDDLLYASFDNSTVWPPDDRMPRDFDWQRIIELGKNPGLGIRNLHAQGITGQGAGIAIIDQTLLVDHQEYKSQLRLYEETDDITGGWLTSHMHGAALASIAVGKTTGVAPGADLYYIATALGGTGEDFTYLARSIRRILHVNQQLPEARKIRVIAMAIGWSPHVKGYNDVTSAAEEAKKAGMLVVCSCIEQVHGFKFHGLGRTPLSDPDAYESYEPGLWWARAFYAGERFSDRILIPMDSRTTASPSGTDDYAFYRQGGWSWSIPYIAGVYALAVQVDPAVTPEQFWSLAMETGNTIELQHNGEIIPFGPIINPGALIKALRSG